MHGLPLHRPEILEQQEPQRYWVHDPPTSGHALTLYQSLSHPWVKWTTPLAFRLRLFSHRLREHTPTEKQTLALELGSVTIGYGSKPIQKTLPTCIGKHGSMPKPLMMITSTSTNGPQSPAAINLAEGAKNPWVTSLGKTTLNICTYNVRTLLGEDRLRELINALEAIKWDILGLCETRMKGENFRVPNNGHALFTIGHENQSIHGVGILVHKHLVGNIKSTHKGNERIAQLILRINKRYNLCITQAYAPTSNSTIEEAEDFYQALSDQTIPIPHWYG